MEGEQLLEILPEVADSRLREAVLNDWLRNLVQSAKTTIPARAPAASVH